METAKEYIAGMAAGVATVLIGHPFDTIKGKSLQEGKSSHMEEHDWKTSGRRLSLLSKCEIWVPDGLPPSWAFHEEFPCSHVIIPIMLLLVLFYKVKLQTQNTDAHSSKYRNAVHCATQILRTEGPKGLYKGATSSFVGVSLESSLLFGAYSQIKATLQGDEVLKGKPPLHVILPAAGLAGAGVGFILCPTELVKCRLQVQAKDFVRIPGQIHYDGPLDCVRKIFRNEQVSGLFRGGLATMMRETFGNMLFFTTYETTRYHLFTAFGLNPNRSAHKDKAVATESLVTNTLLEAGIGIVTGGLAGVAFWTGVLPLDVAKTRIQTARDLSTSRSPVYHLRLIYKQAGVRGLYAGMGPTLTRAFPANAAAIVAWELTARFLQV